LKVVPTLTRIEHRIDRDLAALGGRVLGALDAGEDHLLLQRDAQLLIGLQQLGIDLVQRLRLSVGMLLGLA
jgi:hypothetical protein